MASSYLQAFPRRSVFVSSPRSHSKSRGFWVFLLYSLSSCRHNKWSGRISRPSAQVCILNAISNSLRKAHLPLSFFIASRPDKRLSMAFASGSVKEYHTRLTLDPLSFHEHGTQSFDLSQRPPNVLSPFLIKIFRILRFVPAFWLWGCLLDSTYFSW